MMWLMIWNLETQVGYKKEQTQTKEEAVWPKGLPCLLFWYVIYEFQPWMITNIFIEEQKAKSVRNFKIFTIFL